MNRRFLLVLLLAAPALAGCRMGVQQRAVLTEYEQELRRYEDLIYDLDYENQILCDENIRLKERLNLGDGSRRAVDSPRLFPPPASRPFTPSAPSRSPQPKSSNSGGDDIDLSPPMIEVGPAAESPAPSRLESPLQDRTNPTLESPRIDTPDVPPRSNALPGKSPTLPPSQVPPPRIPLIKPFRTNSLPAPRTESTGNPETLPEAEDKSVSQLFIDPSQTRGIDLDRHAGDDAVHVVIEPRNADGRFIPTAGKVAIVLLDPTQQGEAARVGHWEFPSDVVHHQLRSTGRRNIPLDLPWSGKPPQSGRLAMFVRFETPEGERIEAQREVSITLPGQVSSTWTPRAPNRPGPAVEAKPTVVANARAKHDEQVQPAAAAVAEEVGDAVDPQVIEAAVAQPKKPEWKPFR